LKSQAIGRKIVLLISPTEMLFFRDFVLPEIFIASSENTSSINNAERSRLNLKEFESATETIHFVLLFNKLHSIIAAFRTIDGIANNIRITDSIFTPLINQW
jgi:hypothetical protein